MKVDEFNDCSGDYAHLNLLKRNVILNKNKMN